MGPIRGPLNIFNNIWFIIEIFNNYEFLTIFVFARGSRNDSKALRCFPGSSKHFPWNIGYTLLALVFIMFGFKIIKLWWICFMQYLGHYLNHVRGSIVSFTSVSGGKMVDGLPPVFSFRLRRNFSILFLRILSSGKIILDIIIFRWFFEYIKRVP